MSSVIQLDAGGRRKVTNYLVLFLSPEIAVKCSILNGFRHMLGPDLLSGFQISDGSGHFKDPIMGPGG
jgi:hypothetical protein